MGLTEGNLNKGDLYRAIRKVLMVWVEGRKGRRWKKWTWLTVWCGNGCSRGKGRGGSWCRGGVGEGRGGGDGREGKGSLLEGSHLLQLFLLLW